MVEFQRDSDPACGQILLRPNQSAGWTLNKWLFIACAVVTLSVGAFWWVQGATLVLWFSGLELMVLLGLLWKVCLDCSRQQVILLTADQVIVQSGRDRPQQQFCFQRFHTRVHIDSMTTRGGCRHQVCLCCRRDRVPLGEFLSDAERGLLIDHLKGMVRHYRG